VSKIDLTVPDLGNFDEVAIVDVLIKVGDQVDVETPLVTLETDKATMDVPATAGGIVREVKIRKGDRVSKDSLIALVEAGTGDTVEIPSLRKADSKAALSAPTPAAAPKPVATADEPAALHVEDVGEVGLHLDLDGQADGAVGARRPHRKSGLTTVIYDQVQT